MPISLSLNDSRAQKQRIQLTLVRTVCIRVELVLVLSTLVLLVRFLESLMSRSALLGPLPG